MSEEVTSSGWNAIDEAVQRIYGDQEPKHYGTMIPYMLGGPDPLEGISVYEASAPYAHWHFVTYGFSELHEKESKDAEVSGYGFELTFRLRKTAEEEEPPAWALNLLQNMGRYVFNSGNTFTAGDYLDANGPICLDSDTQLTALAFIEDPELPEMDTPNGQVNFLQMIGITIEELQAMQLWNTRGVLNASSEYMPYYITVLERDSLLKQPSIMEAVRTGSERDGSSTGFLFVDQLAWEPGKKKFFSSTPARLQLGAKQAEIIGKLLSGRILKGNPLRLIGQGIRVVFESGERPALREEDGEIRLSLDEEAVTLLTRYLRPVMSTFELPAFKGVSFQIVKTEITDQDGNVIKTIG